MLHSYLPALAAAAAGVLAILAAASGTAPALLGLVSGLLLAAAGFLLHRAGFFRPKVAAGETAAATGEASPAMPQAAIARTLMDKLPTPLLVIARNGRIIYANPAARGALDRLQDGAHFASLIRAPAFVEAVSATLLDGEERRSTFTADPGRERFFEARVAALPADGVFGAQARIIAQIEDRTETRRSEQLRSDFIANASHELRTPLASIIGYIETLQHHARDDAEARERFLGIMGREAARMARLVEDLMSLSRIEMSEHLRPVEECSLNAIAAECAGGFQPLAAQRDVALDIALEPHGAQVRGDRDQLYQVFTNLIDNAIKYAGRGASVCVRGAEPSRAFPGRDGVTVEDTGPGIGREHLHRLTERFYRVNASASRNKGGTGLGLAIAKHILNRHGGRLEIASTLGKGSAFTVWLPPLAEAQAERQAAAPEELARSTA